MGPFQQARNAFLPSTGITACAQQQLSSEGLQAALLAVRKQFAPEHLPLKQAPGTQLTHRMTGCECAAAEYSSDQQSRHQTSQTAERSCTRRLADRTVCQVQQAVSALRRRGTAAKCTQLLTVWCWQGLTIPQTVQIFQQARIVLAPHGAGLANTIFCGYVLVCCSMR